MQLFPAIFEPLTESVVIGVLACWAVSYLWEFSAILFFIKHVLLWFVLDYLLLRCVQGVSNMGCFFLLQAHVELLLLHDFFALKWKVLESTCITGQRNWPHSDLILFKKHVCEQGFDTHLKLNIECK